MPKAGFLRTFLKQELVCMSADHHHLLQARSHGGAFGVINLQISFVPPRIFLFPEKFVLKI